jgi:tRNA-specific 2-thiouridylase
MCNQHVKFGAFLDFAKKNGADYIATGHYAQVEKNGDNYQLKKGTDPKKDQSYFLWTLSQAQLSQTLFPIGDTPKESIRQEANTAGLPTAVKKDSQGICFLGQVDVPEFLGHFIDLKSGDVLNETGEVIGNHKGALVYTLGQRHGFGIENQENTSEPRYVIAKDVANNTITVSTKPPVTDNLGIITLDSVNWINELTDSKKLTAVFRYHGTPAKVTGLEIFKDQCGLKLDKEIDKPDSGQSCVIYQGDECLGGGIII